MIFSQADTSTILYVLGFIFLLIWAIKSKISYVALYVIVIWVLSAVSALIFQMSYFGYRDLSLIPYAFLFACFFISLYPLRYLQNVSDKGIQKIDVTFYKYLILVFVVVSIVPFIENLNYVLHTFRTNSESLSDMYDNKMEDSGSAKLVTWLSPLGRFGNSVDGVFFDFLIFSFFYLLTTDIKKYFIILMFIPIANHLLFQLAMAGRTAVVMFFLISVFFILFFYKLIPSRNFPFIRNVGIIVASAFIVGLLFISFSRKEAHNRNDSNIVFYGMYLGKGHLDFNEKMWSIRKNTEGDNCFSLAKKCLGMDTYTNYLDRRKHWSQAKIGIQPHIFYTYIGDLFMDLHVFSLVFLLFISFLMNRKLKINKPYSILFCFFLYVYVRIMVMGWSTLSFKTYVSSFNLLLSVILLYFTTKIRIVNRRRLNMRHKN